MPRSTVNRLTLALSLGLGTLGILPLLGCGETSRIDPNAASSKVDTTKVPPEPKGKDKAGKARESAPKRRLSQDNG